MSANNYFAVRMRRPAPAFPDAKEDSYDLAKRVSTELVARLRDRRLKCTDMRAGSFCLGTTCAIGDAKVDIAVFNETEKLPDGSLRVSIWCTNHVPVPWWRKLIPRALPIPPETLNTGEALESVCQTVAEILQSVTWASTVRVERFATLKEWESR